MSWEEALQQSVDCPSLKCHASNTQLSAYLMAKYEEYGENHEDGSQFKIAAKHLGLQNTTDFHKVWVLNKSLQVNNNGEELLLSSSPYVWLGDFAAKCKGLSSYAVVNASLAVKINGTLSKKNALVKLVKHLKQTYEDNYPAALLTLGAQIMSVHYEALFEDGGYNVPVTLLHGEVSHGKSLATRAALSMIGTQESHFLTGISDSKSTQLTSVTSLGIVIDDPSDVKEISEKILYFYDKGTQAKCNSSHTPKCTFISSINEELLLKLTALPDRWGVIT